MRIPDAVVYLPMPILRRHDGRTSKPIDIRPLLISRMRLPPVLRHLRVGFAATGGKFGLVHAVALNIFLARLK